MDYFESKGFYTFLYRFSYCKLIISNICGSGSIAFMCYIFFYVLRVKVVGKSRDTTQMEVDTFIRKMAKVREEERGRDDLSQATGVDITEVASDPGDSRAVRRLQLNRSSVRSSRSLPGVLQAFSSRRTCSPGGGKGGGDAGV